MREYEFVVTGTATATQQTKTAARMIGATDFIVIVSNCNVFNANEDVNLFISTI